VLLGTDGSLHLTSVLKRIPRHELKVSTATETGVVGPRSERGLRPFHVLTFRPMTSEAALCADMPGPAKRRFPEQANSMSSPAPPKRRTRHSWRWLHSGTDCGEALGMHLDSSRRIHPAEGVQRQPAQ